MWRGILSIIALLLMCGSSIIIAVILAIPSMGFHIVAPVLQPLHQPWHVKRVKHLNMSTIFLKMLPPFIFVVWILLGVCAM